MRPTPLRLYSENIERALKIIRLQVSNRMPDKFLAF